LVSGRAAAAVVSFTLGLIGFLGLGFFALGAFLGPPAILLGWFGRTAREYRVLAWTGVILGAFLTFLLVFLILEIRRS
jgi:hypothetical protein